MTRDERQLLAVNKWKQSKCRGTIVAGTGFGKTKTALDAIERVLLKNPTVAVVVVVPTVVLKKQWQNNLIERNLGNVSVLIINTASKRDFNCDFLIIDECQHISAVKLSSVFTKCNPTFILGLTATYERLDGRERSVLDKYAPVCDEITIEEATENGWVSPYTEYKVLLDVDLTKYNEYNIDFMRCFSFFDFDFNLAISAASSKFVQHDLAQKMNVPIKDVQSCAYGFIKALKGRKDFIASHPKKIEIAKKIINSRRGSKIITFNSSIKQCESYQMGYILHSGITKKKNQMTIQDFSSCKTGVLHTSKMADEGLDIKGLNVAILTGFNSSKISKRQRIGRCIRFEPGKQAEIFTLVIKGTVEEKWYQKSGEDLYYVEINESELDSILNNNKLKNKRKIKQEKTITNDIFRF